MSSSVSRLVYISSNRIEGDDAAVRDAIDDILEKARKANAAVGITGALMFNHGCFAQVLEGERDHIEKTFERIQCDERHSDVVILSFETVESHIFSSWSMGYVGEDQEISQAFDSIRSTSGFEAANLPSEHIFNLLKERLVEAESDSARRQNAA
ncbi:MAG: BLUF domain-containing protein [Granulosicoccus sp.]